MPDADQLIAAVTGGLLPAPCATSDAGELRLHCLVWGARRRADRPARARQRRARALVGSAGRRTRCRRFPPRRARPARARRERLAGHAGLRHRRLRRRSPRHRRSARARPRFAIIAHSMGARAAAWFSAHASRARARPGAARHQLAGVDAETAQRWRGRVIGQRAGRSYPSYAEAVAAFRFVPPERRRRASDRRRPRPSCGAASADRASGPSASIAPSCRSTATAPATSPALVADLPCPLWIGRGAGSLVIPRPRPRHRCATQHPDVEVHDFAGAHHFFLSDPASAGSRALAAVSRPPAALTGVPAQARSPRTRSH